MTYFCFQCPHWQQYYLPISCCNVRSLFGTQLLPHLENPHIPSFEYVFHMFAHMFILDIWWYCNDIKTPDPRPTVDGTDLGSQWDTSTGRCYKVLKSTWHMVISRCLGMTQNGKPGSSRNLDVGKTSWPLLAPNSSHSQTEHRKFLNQLVPDHWVLGVIPPCFSVWDGTSLPPIMVCQNWNHLQDMARLIQANWILKKYW